VKSRDRIGRARRGTIWRGDGLDEELSRWFDAQARSRVQKSSQPQSKHSASQSPTHATHNPLVTPFQRHKKDRPRVGCLAEQREPRTASQLYSWVLIIISRPRAQHTRHCEFSLVTAMAARGFFLLVCAALLAYAHHAGKSILIPVSTGGPHWARAAALRIAPARCASQQTLFAHPGRHQTLPSNRRITTAAERPVSSELVPRELLREASGDKELVAAVRSYARREQRAERAERVTVAAAPKATKAKKCKKGG